MLLKPLVSPVESAGNICYMYEYIEHWPWNMCRQPKGHVYPSLNASPNFWMQGAGTFPWYRELLGGWYIIPQYHEHGTQFTKAAI